jgi:hypothetical protein
MVKRTLIAIAVVALLASVAPAEIEVHYWGPIGDDEGVKVDGNDDNIYWPYQYIALDLCSMPVKMEIGMYVEVQDCNKKAIKLKQVDCSEISKGGGDFPCYHDCEKFKVRANFDVQLGTRLVKGSAGVIDGWSAYYKGDSIIPGDGADHEVEVCVKAWKAKLWVGTVGQEVTVGELFITAKPAV